MAEVMEFIAFLPPAPELQATLLSLSAASAEGADRMKGAAQRRQDQEKKESYQGQPRC